MGAGVQDREYRNALGRFATGVCLVTTQTAHGPLGMTVNSFASVSLDPRLVLWSPARKSARFAAFEAASHFAIHVLSLAQEEIANRFARDGFAFEGLTVEDGIGKAPLIPDAVARFECSHAAQYDGGDHLIVVGEVERFHYCDAEPLLYYKGAYARSGGTG